MARWLRAEFQYIIAMQVDLLFWLIFSVVLGLEWVGVRDQVKVVKLVVGGCLLPFPSWLGSWE